MRSPLMRDTSAAVDVSVLARGTPGFSGAELQNVVNHVSFADAGLFALRVADALYGVFAGRRARCTQGTGAGDCFRL